MIKIKGVQPFPLLQLRRSIRIVRPFTFLRLRRGIRIVRPFPFLRLRRGKSAVLPRVIDTAQLFRQSLTLRQADA